jgi:hypothetical protein
VVTRRFICVTLQVTATDGCSFLSCGGWAAGQDSTNQKITAAFLTQLMDAGVAFRLQVRACVPWPLTHMHNVFK